MIRRLSIHAALCAGLAAACGGGGRAPAPPRPTDVDPEGSRRDAVAAAVKPYFDAELLSGLVVGLYDAGRREIYGFGKGPGGATPDGRSLFELGTVTRVYTGLLLADAIQRREIDLEAAVAEYLPPGVTVPTRDQVAITLRHLALHSSGLPPVPPGVAVGSANPFGGYDEEALYRDLVRTQLAYAPGTAIQISSYGTGLLGFAIGRKIGTGYQRAVEARILGPLELRDTVFAVPAAAARRRMVGTDSELAAVPRWTWDALAGAGGLVSSARDQLQLIEAELDAAAGGKNLPLRSQMRLTQEPQLDAASPQNAGLGWVIDGDGRYWHGGGTAGFRAFVGFDPKTHRGVVALASTASPLVERLGRALFGLFEATPPRPWTAPTAAQLASYAGSYDLGGTKLAVVAAGKRLYLESPNEPRVRLLPVSDHEFWIEVLQAVAIFQKEGDKVARVVFGIGARQLAAPRVP
jgi:CubicO group peptidase (beta-lactamase class C family)